MAPTDQAILRRSARSQRPARPAYEVGLDRLAGLPLARAVSDEADRSDGDLGVLEHLTRPGREEDLRAFLLLLHPADVADLVAQVDEKTAVAILKHLESDQAAELLSELDAEEQERILAHVHPDQLAPIVGEMETDDVADFLQDLDEDTAQQVLATLPREEQDDVTKLMAYAPDSAGGIMQTELVTVPIDATVESTITAVREGARQADVLSVFVVDHGGRYAGHVALQELVLATPDTAIETLMEPKTVEVRVDFDQEKVARIFDRYSLVEVGVTNDEGQLVGRITADDVHEVLVEEAEEDMLKMAGTSAEPDIIYSNRILRIVWLRLPWLASTFFATLIAAAILERAADDWGAVAKLLLVLAPVIMAMSGNVGTQSAMIMIRGMTSGHIRSSTIYRDMLKDLSVCALIAAIGGCSATLIVSMWYGDLGVGLCVGTSLSASMVMASVLGTVEPPLLKRLGVDPAVAAGPLITSLNDITGALIYTGVAFFFLQYLL